MQQEYYAPLNEMNEREYIRGFNAASILADYEPEVLNEIVPDNNPSDNFFDGFFAGKLYYKQELEQDEQLREFFTIRNSTNEREVDKEL